MRQPQQPASAADLPEIDIPDIRKPTPVPDKKDDPVQEATGAFQTPTVEFLSDEPHPATNLTWEAAEIAYVNGQRQLVAVFTHGDIIIAVGDDGYIVFSDDGAKSWRAMVVEQAIKTNFSDAYLANVGKSHSNIQLIATGISNSKNSIATLPQLHVTKLNSKEDIQKQLEINWTHVPITAGHPLITYAALTLGLMGLLFTVYQIIRFLAVRKNNDGTPVGAGTSDRAIGWSDADVLGIQGLAIQLSRFLRNVQTVPPLVIGVSGGWGSGKTSFMNLLYEDLARRENSAVWFNAWHHQHEEHLLASLFESIRTRGIPSFFTIHGVWFRARLVGPRLLHVFQKVAPALIIVLLVLSFYFYQLDQSAIDELSSLITRLVSKLSPNEFEWQYAGVPTVLLAIYALYSAFMSVWSALPTKPTKLVGYVNRLTGLGNFSDQLSFRHKFGREFSQVCHALRTPGRPGLVVFIDDLDRCDGKATLTILEAINYLVSEGDCIVVLGFDRAQVENSIGNELKDFAANAQIEIPLHLHDSGDEEKLRQQAYARYYLEKLINIDVAIPKLSKTGAFAMAAPDSINNEVKELSTLTEKERHWIKIKRPSLLSQLTQFRKMCSALLLLLLFSLPLYLGATKLIDFQYDTVDQNGETPSVMPASDEQLEGQENRPSPGSGEGETSDGGTVDDSESIDPSWPREPQFDTPVISDALSHNHRGLENLFIWPLVLFLLTLALVRFLRRTMTIRAEIETDPDSFTTALSNANALIQRLNGTPRTIKRFMNKMRFESIRLRKVNFVPMGIDTAARWLDWVGKEFSDKAYSEPRISDEQLIAIGALEKYLGEFDDDLDYTDLDGILTHHSNSRPNQPNIPEEMITLLRDSQVDASAIKTYRQQLGQKIEV